MYNKENFDPNPRDHFLLKHKPSPPKKTWSPLTGQSPPLNLISARGGYGLCPQYEKIITSQKKLLDPIKD